MLINLRIIHIRMIFTIQYPTLYPACHFELGYPYPADPLKSDVDTLKRIRSRMRCGNYPIRLHPYLQVRFISSDDQLADVFTKPATRQMLDRFRTNLNLVQSRSSD